MTSRKFAGTRWLLTQASPHTSPACKSAENRVKTQTKCLFLKEGTLTEEISHQLRASFQSNSFQRARHGRLIHVNDDKNVFHQVPAAQFELSAHAQSDPARIDDVTHTLFPTAEGSTSFVLQTFKMSVSSLQMLDFYYHKGEKQKKTDYCSLNFTCRKRKM